MAERTPLRPKPAPLDIRDLRNFTSYLAGIAVEIAAVLALTAIGFAVAFLGFYLWR